MLLDLAIVSMCILMGKKKREKGSRALTNYEGHVFRVSILWQSCKYGWRHWRGREEGREGRVLQGQISRCGGHMAEERAKSVGSSVHNLHICALNGVPICFIGCKCINNVTAI